MDFVLPKHWAQATGVFRIPARLKDRHPPKHIKKLKWSRSCTEQGDRKDHLFRASNLQCSLRKCLYFFLPRKNEASMSPNTSSFCGMAAKGAFNKQYLAMELKSMVPRTCSIGGTRSSPCQSVSFLTTSHHNKISCHGFSPLGSWDCWGPPATCSTCKLRAQLQGGNSCFCSISYTQHPSGCSPVWDKMQDELTTTSVPIPRHARYCSACFWSGKP